MSVVFGPVNSRRFGKSLGIDLSPNYKQCNFDCLYCELKPSKIVEKSADFPKISDILNDVKNALIYHKNCDVLTITANGEPTLYPYLGELVNELNKIKSNLKLLILSNGTIAKDYEKMDCLKNIDIVKFSLDSVLQKTFRKIDRGKKDLLVENLVENMAKFSKNFNGELVLEILVVKNLNDNEAEFKALNEAIKKINPNRVDISSVDRPPAYKIQGVSSEILQNLAKFIEFPCVIASHKYDGKKENFSEVEILKMLKLRPQSVTDIEKFFDDNSRKIVENLLKTKKIENINLAGAYFYKLCKDIF